MSTSVWSGVRSRPRRTGLLLSALVAGTLLALLPPLAAGLLLAGTGLLVLAAIAPQAALAALLILAPLRALIISETVWPLPLDIGQLLLLLWLLALVMHGTRPAATLAGKWPAALFRTPLLIPPVLILTGTLAGAFHAAAPAVWLGEWLKWLALTAVTLLVFHNTRDRGFLLTALLTGGALNALIGLYQFFGGSGALHLLVSGRFFRAFGTFGQPNPFGGYLALLIPPALCLTLAQFQRFWRRREHVALLTLLSGAGASALMLAGMLASWSRGAWLACGASLLVMLVALPRRLAQGLLLAGAVALLLVMAWNQGWIPASLSQRLGSATAEYFALEDARGVDITPANYAALERLAHWQAALNMAHEFPWTGVGLGNYEVAYEHHRLLNWPEPLGHAHNEWLNMLAESGVPGLILFIAAWGLIFRFTWRARRHPDQQARLLVIGLLGSWSALAVHSLFDKLYVNNLFLHIGALLGLLALVHDEACHFPRLPARV